MPFDLLTFGEALAEIMRKRVGAPLDQAEDFIGPYPSGAPFIFAVQAARLGAKVGVIGCVGANEGGEPDAFGRNLIRQLETDGVDTRGVYPIPGHATGVAFIAYNDDGTRDFVFHAQHAAAGQLSPDMLDESLFVGLKCLHITGSALSIGQNALAVGKRALELAQRHGAIISFDPNIRPQLMSPERARVEFQPYLQAARYILPTTDEARLLTGEKNFNDAAVALLNGHPDRIVVMTLAHQGCIAFKLVNDVLKTTRISGFNVEEVDPTGAGDCFDAGFLARILVGESQLKAARYANACGALAVTEQGPMAGAKTLLEVQAFLDTHWNDKQIIDLLERHEVLQTVVLASENSIFYVRVFSRSERPRNQANAKYVLDWVQMSRKLIDSYHQGNDITKGDAEFYKREYATDEDELKRLLAVKDVILTDLESISNAEIKLP